VTPPSRAGLAGRGFALAGGLVFAASLAYFLYAYWQYGRTTGPWTNDGWTAVVTNAGMFTVFALHHSVFARTGIKAAISARVSPPLERATYVWIASLLFLFTLWAWAPVPGLTWRVTGVAAWLLYLGWLAGFLLTAIASSALDPLDLAGVRQAFGHAAPGDVALSTTGAYGLVRHPIYLGWVLLVWSVPVMTGTRLVFAAISTLYLVVAIPLEERQMRRTLGAAYDTYARAVRWRMIPGVY
jgi:protein-S-isoprenylcysteine O-methyltransferase Ste14